MRLRKVDVINSLDPLVYVIDSNQLEFYPELAALKIPEGYKFLIDAEGEIVAIVPDKQYKDWDHAKTVAELLNWAEANYPYLPGDDNGSE
jgi:hypothetical protein